MKIEKGYICDFMLGRLAKWMRLLGLDTLYYNQPEDLGIIHIAKREGRVILTRSKELSGFENAILICSENLNEQMEQMGSRISKSALNPFSRCPECNTPLIKVDKKEIEGEVPEYIYKVHSRFKRCPDCKRIYWRGTHYKEIKRKIDEIIS
ncbi:Mut7-C RNAse domain-containing protein [candidate division WOR-3 bacterium]|nr:Mut7-C RNAse domain-containing protein [candidate division WOR-3 bacterium]MCK4527841.1 Mut7-C RNAse domain-containing protein [candidate division WOR-3 bacterium]